MIDFNNGDRAYVVAALINVPLVREHVFTTVNRAYG